MRRNVMQQSFEAGARRERKSKEVDCLRLSRTSLDGVTSGRSAGRRSNATDGRNPDSAPEL